MPTPKKYASAAQRQAAYRQRLAAQTQTKARAIPTMPGYRRWKVMRIQCLSILDALTGEMETYRDQRSEHWRDSERGEAFDEVVESIAEIVAALRDLDSD